MFQILAVDNDIKYVASLFKLSVKKSTPERAVLFRADNKMKNHNYADNYENQRHL